MKKEWEYKFWDDYYDYCASIWYPDLTSPDPKKRKLAEYMVKAMEEEKQYEHTAVSHPRITGHSVVLRHKRGEPRPKAYFEKEVEVTKEVEVAKEVDLPKAVEILETLEISSAPKPSWYKRVWAQIKDFLSS